MYTTRQLESYPALIISGTSGRPRAGITSGSLFWGKKTSAGRFLTHQELFRRQKFLREDSWVTKDFLEKKQNPAGRFLSHQGLVFRKCVFRKSPWIIFHVKSYDSGSWPPCMFPALAQALLEWSGVEWSEWVSEWMIIHEKTRLLKKNTFFTYYFFIKSLFPKCIRRTSEPIRDFFYFQEKKTDQIAYPRFGRFSGSEK